ncbi:MAG: hypothetical protein WDW36_006474 [Sanguina aurantia]
MQLAEAKYKELAQENGLAEREGVEMRIVGDLSLLPSAVQGAAARLMQNTASLKRCHAVLNICFSYTSTEELLCALSALQGGLASGALSSSDISPGLLDQCLRTRRDSPAVDLLIRTSGESRLSDFMLWQASGAFLAFIDVLWPDLTFCDVAKCVLQYQASRLSQAPGTVTVTATEPHASPPVEHGPATSGHLCGIDAAAAAAAAAKSHPETSNGSPSSLSSADASAAATNSDSNTSSSPCSLSEDEFPECGASASPTTLAGSGVSDARWDPDICHGAADVLELKSLRQYLTPRDSPFVRNNNSGGGFVGDTDRIRLHTVEYESRTSAGAFCLDGSANVGDEDSCIMLPEWAIRCGPRKTIYLDPKKVCAAVVTCGGLCPGLNDVVQNIVYTLADYGVPEDNILGIRYGLRGFYERDAKPITLTRSLVDGIQLKGGTMLGTSRGGANIREIVRRIDLWGLNMVFVVGGNGGNAAAHAIQEECEAQGVICSVVGVPKSIDNDILLIDRCFGFETAVEEAQRALLAAKVEASSARNGLGVVKLMGRQSGFIAMQASMASGVVDICLIPEISFNLEKVCEHVARCIEAKGHCVVCLAEGAGQDLIQDSTSLGTDQSGNPILEDIGLFLKNKFKEFFKGEADIKYIDPTYMIRAIPTTSNDRIYCKVLGQGAVHGAFAGFTDITVGLISTHYVYLPIPTIIQAPRKVNPKGRRWNRLITGINQPEF